MAMNRASARLPGMLLLGWFGLIPSGAAIDIAWFEQRRAGSAAGELRIANLQPGKLDIETPGRNLEVGIVRIDDRAVVTLSRRNPERQLLPSGEPGNPETLTVTARQGDASARATFRIAPAAPAAPAEEAPNVSPGAAAREQRMSMAGRNGRTVNPPGAGGAAAAPAGLPSPPDDACPVLTVRPGSLRSNVSRLLGECGAGLGEWVTGGGRPGFYTDWIVPDPAILAEHNRRGLAGLLAQLERHYGLRGVRHPRLPHTIDVYRIPEGEEHQ